MAEKTRVNSAGLLEGYDEETGKVLWVQKTKEPMPEKMRKRVPGSKPGRKPKDERPTHHWIKDAHGRRLWVPVGTNPDDQPTTVYPFSQVTSSAICQLVTEGKTLKEISRIEGFPPYYVIYEWKRKYPEFCKDLELALKDRAHFYFDEVIALMHDTDNFNVKGNRLKAAILQWAAEVGNPDQYGKRTKVVGDANAPLALIVDTGIRRDDDGEKGAIETTGKALEGEPA